MGASRGVQVETGGGWTRSARPAIGWQEVESPRDRKALRLREDMGLREVEEQSAGARAGQGQPSSGSGKSQKQKEGV